MTKELCGHVTENGPCTMRKGHLANWHRHRTYDALSWIIRSDNGEVLDTGEGVNPLTYAISRNRVVGTKLLVEITC